MANYNFKKDIKEGKEGEEVVIKFLQSKGNVLVSRCDTKIHDFIMKTPINETLSYEVKTDVKVFEDNDTRNMFIEYQSRGVPSGIAVTKSDWYAYHFKHLNEIWFIKTSKLKKMIEKYPFHSSREDSGDPGSVTIGYLIPRFAKPIFKQFKIYKIENERI